MPMNKLCGLSVVYTLVQSAGCSNILFQIVLRLQSVKTHYLQCILKILYA